MKYGYFNDVSKEYIITSPKTPLPWINYLGCENFYSLISNTCGGYSFYKDAKLLRLTRYRYNNCPNDVGGKYFYINDSGTVWNPGWQPVKNELDTYECRHGLGYSIFKGTKNGVAVKLTTFVPLGENCEVTKVEISNETNSTKNLSLFSLVEFCLWNAVDDSSNFQRNYSIGEVEILKNEIYHKTEYRERRNHYSFFSCNKDIHGFDTCRDAFCGEYRGFENPKTVFDNVASNSIASGWSPIGSHHIKLTLNPNETESIIFVLGYIENDDDEKWEKPGIINKSKANSLLNKFKTDEQINTAFEELKNYWDELLSKFQVNSADEKLNRMVNIWNQYQCMVTFNMSRSASYYESGMGRGMGFRDSCQDILGFVHLVPQKARERLLDIAATQFEDGSAYHQYQPLTKRGNLDVGSGFNDDPLWLIAATAAYLKETGDFSVLSEEVPYNNDTLKSAPLLNHLKRSFNFTVNNKGPHGLPLIGRADWNDCLNLNCFSATPGESFQTCSNYESGKAESIFIAGMFVKYGKEYAEINKLLGNEEEYSRALNEVSAMYSAVIEHGWDGEWFLRAYDAFEKPVGSTSCDEGKIFIEPQGMCVMAGIGIEEGLAEKSLKSVEKYLDTKYGIVLVQPAYTKYHLNLGEISSYPPGYKENAGIFCHNNPWIVCAETLLGHGNRAFEVYKKTCPSYIEDISEIHRTEPYVYSQMIAGIDAIRFGEAKNSWLTGTAAWSFTGISQFILGVTPDYTGLRINPCLPDNLKHVEITRYFRGNVYHITLDNSNSIKDRKPSIYVDDKEIFDSLLPLDKSKKHVNVRVVI